MYIATSADTCESQVGGRLGRSWWEARERLGALETFSHTHTLTSDLPPGWTNRMEAHVTARLYMLSCFDKLLFPVHRSLVAYAKVLRPTFVCMVRWSLEDVWPLFKYKQSNLHPVKFT